MLSTSADWEIWVRLSLNSNLGYIHEPLVKYRMHPNQMHKNIYLMEKDMLYAFEKLKKMGVFETRHYYHFCYSKLALVLSGSYFHHTREYLKVLRYLLISFIHDPKSVIKKLLME